MGAVYYSQLLLRDRDFKKIPSIDQETPSRPPIRRPSCWFGDRLQVLGEHCAAKHKSRWLSPRGGWLSPRGGRLSYAKHYKTSLLQAAL